MSDDGIPSPTEYIPIPDDHYAALGRVADAWADLEFEIDQLIWQLLQVPQALGACVTAQMISIHPRLRALRALVRLYEISEPIQKTLGGFAGEAHALAEKRNRTIHDKRLMWAKSREVVRFQVTADTKLIFGPQAESIGALNEFTATIRSMMERFLRIRDEIENELRSSPDKRRAPLPHIARWRGTPYSDSQPPPPPPEPSQG